MSSPSVAQVHFSVLDLDLHSAFTAGEGETAFERDAALAARTSVMPPFPEDRFLCSFSHIFAGGYSAGYYRCGTNLVCVLFVQLL